VTELSFYTLQKKLDNVAQEFDGRARKSRMVAIGKECEKDVERAIRGDINDLSMSGWSRSKPMDMTGHSEIASSVDMGLFIAGAAKSGLWHRGLGGMRVLQDGRKAYAKGDRRRSGTRIRKKDGVVVEKFRKVKRTTGATQGKGTWDDAVAEIEKNIGKRIHAGIVQDTLRRYF
jgi:hypothetical protein